MSRLKNPVLSSWRSAFGFAATDGLHVLRQVRVMSGGESPSMVVLIQLKGKWADPVLYLRGYDYRWTTPGGKQELK